MSDLPLAASAEAQWLVYGPPVRGRTCGSCRACCTQVPVHLSPTQYKPANVACMHACSRGCRVYEKRPEPCRYWSCAWLIHENTAALRRPDRAGYVIDAQLDDLLVNGEKVRAVQVWVDPAQRDAHRDPAFRAWLDLVAMPAIIRYGSREGFVLFPGSITHDGQAAEMASTINTAIGDFAQLSPAERAIADAGELA